MNAPLNRPNVGTAAIVLRDGKVLLGKRKGSHGAGLWALPGGHLEHGEDFAESLAREVLEETNLVITNVKKGTFTNDVFSDEQKHYVTLYFTAEAPEGEPELLEPNKCEGWGWFTLDSLPSPLWPGLEETLREAIR